MARPLRIEYPGAIYHITARGNEKKIIFREDHDYITFLDYLDLCVNTFRLSIFAYSLMPNHYHLVMQTSDANLSRAMHQLNTAYTVYFNRKHGRIGHLFQGRYKAILVQKNPYLLEVSRYVHLNAFRAHLVDDPIKYRWSSYRNYISEKPVPKWLNINFILAMIVNRNKNQRLAYKEFVKDGIQNSVNPFDKIYAQTILGNTDFIDDVIGKNVLSTDHEMPATKKLGNKITFKRIISVVGEVLKKGESEIIKGGRYSLGRKIAIYLLRTRTDLSLKEIGGYFNISYSAVTQLKNLIEKKLQEDIKLKMMINQINTRLGT